MSNLSYCNDIIRTTALCILTRLFISTVTDTYDTMIQFHYMWLHVTHYRSSMRSSHWRLSHTVGLQCGTNMIHLSLDLLENLLFFLDKKIFLPLIFSQYRYEPDDWNTPLWKFILHVRYYDYWCPGEPRIITIQSCRRQSSVCEMAYSNAIILCKTFPQYQSNWISTRQNSNPNLKWCGQSDHTNSVRRDVINTAM